MIAYRLPTAGNPDAALSGLLARFLEESRAGAVLAMALTGHSSLPMPALVTRPDQMAACRPLSPAMPVNSARVASRVARHPAGRLILVLRPCEHRALVELAKLKQCDLSAAVILSAECPGRLETSRYLQASSENEDFSAEFLADASLKNEIARSCSSCRDFQPEAADIRICLLGLDAADHLALLPQTARGRELLEGLGLESVDIPDRTEAAAATLAQRQENHHRLLEEIRRTVGNLDGLEKFFGSCINCQNCRVNCPVCYCRDCVFNTDVFDHQPEDYLRRAARGRVKLPTDTTMFHLTRMAHMAHACVGCGACSSACPNGIPVADLFRAVADKVQAAYGYKPGQDQPIPYQVWDEAQGKGSHA